MTGIPRSIAEHELRIPPGVKPVVQKKRSLAPKRSLAACQEVEMLVSAGILWEVKYQSWVANPVMGYHEILMKEENEEKTVFHTDKGIFCYQKMPFGLKNAGATYQRLVDKAFASQIGRNMEAYVDDLVIKSKTEYQMLDDIHETFKNLRKVNMKLNPKKCSFGFEEGKFLGHIVGKQSIKANPNKVKAVLETKPPQSKKEGAPKKKFKLTEEAEEAFNQMKQHLASLPKIAALETGELISVYLSVGEEAISTFLTIERDKVQTTNNEAEYEALIAGLKLAKEMKVQKLQVFTELLLVSSQVNDCYVAKEPNMKRYKEKSKELINTFQTCTVKQILRSQNKKADALSKLTSLTFAHLTKKVQDVITEESPNWITPIKKFLKDSEILYKKGYLAPLLRCVGPEQSQYLVKEVHEGICGAHFGARTVVAKLMNLGYFWPSMHRDTVEQLRKCEACQVHAPVPKSPKHDLVTISSAWPFHKWGMDIVGPFPPAKGGVKFLLVAIDYFTKWPEVKPLAKITGKQVIDFVWENIICRYGLPGVLITDNGKQFAEKPFSTYCKEFRITQVFSSVACPQSNGQVERMNWSIVEGIKTRLGRHESNWLEELANVLWAIRTTEKASHKRTPYSLVFGSEAVIPTEVGVLTQRTLNMDPETNNKETMLNLQFLEETRDQAAIQEAKYKQKMKAYYNKKVKNERFKP
ncbi:uncharacterized protein LOC110931477 [Helianthus annuus]|uniref:uncharacterized protein LOC110931477 n=1 Tax=Helianthus annuus TaxID=4232 RepID=UPI000B8FCAB8|nr:uncharacterized protein LOC110931477 [Helianthus annuus]